LSFAEDEDEEATATAGSLFVAGDFTAEMMLRLESTSISWNTPSRWKVGLYSAGTLARRRSTSCSAPMTSVGWSFDDRIDDAKLVTGTNYRNKKKLKYLEKMPC
jgi:hypothetical protein